MAASGQLHVLPTETYFTIVRQMLDENGQAGVRVTGMSMWPILYHMRDSVVISKPAETGVHVGDIVLFDRRNGRYALHRVIHKGKTCFAMAGDHQWYIDRRLPYEQIVGVVTQINRNGRWLKRGNPFVKCYGFVVTVLTEPRIFLWKMVRGFRSLFVHMHAGESSMVERRQSR